jgi:hypothetical protein
VNVRQGIRPGLSVTNTLAYLWQRKKFCNTDTFVNVLPLANVRKADIRLGMPVKNTLAYS